MAKNDKILIDGIIDERIALRLPTEKRDEVFEYFAFEQILKDHDLTRDEINSGNVDGENDGGIDGFFIFVNGHLLSDAEKFPYPKTGSVLEIWIITCKHHDTFKQAPLDNLVASLSELFDLSLEDNNLKGDYSEELLLQRNNFKFAYKRTSSTLIEFKVSFRYASRGNTEELGESVKSRAGQLEGIAKDNFGNSITQFKFLGSTELIDQYRKKPNFSLDLPFSDYLSSGETYVVLVKLKDYYNFITDEHKLRRYLFDSNVRDFMGLNRVNEDIKNTLTKDQEPDFWWLNNGVTILANDASVVGKSIQIQDVQIVNGLQTSESIFRHFSSGGSDSTNRSVLVKIIKTKNTALKDEIIRATNNQTAVELSSLHATDKIQRDVEDALKLEDFYYERRVNYYKNQGIAPNKIVSPLYMAAGFVSLILKSPEQASNLKSKFMRKQGSYNRVFSVKSDLEVWPKIASVLKSSDDFLEAKRPAPHSNSERFLKNRRQFLSFLTISRLLNNFNFTVPDLIKMDISLLTSDEFEKTWAILNPTNPIMGYSKIKRAAFLSLCRKLNEDNTIKGYERLDKGFDTELGDLNNSGKVGRKTWAVSEDFIIQVDTLLPQQPWVPRIHQELASKLDCSVRKVNLAIKTLVASGKRYKQINGVLYNQKGEVVQIS